MSFHYSNTEIKTHQTGGKVVRKVSIKNGKGYKSVTKYHKGNKIGTVKKRIHKHHIESIQNGKFIPGLFMDCNCKVKNKQSTRRFNRKI